MITLLTIGQTPREDLMKAFHLGGVDELQLIGALDDVSQEKINWLANQPGEEKLYVVLKNGMANINHQLIEQKIEKLIKEYEKSSEAIAVLCMSEFECTSNQTPVIYPVQEMKEAVAGIQSEDTTVIFVPIKEQLKSAHVKWSNVQGKKHFAAVHPKSPAVLDEIEKEIEFYQANHIIMDCYGYDYELVAKIENKYPCSCHNVQHLVVQRVKKVKHD